MSSAAKDLTTVFVNLIQPTAKSINLFSNSAEVIATYNYVFFQYKFEIWNKKYQI
jgi:hypothetical protein